MVLTIGPVEKDGAQSQRQDWPMLSPTTSFVGECSPGEGYHMQHTEISHSAPLSHLAHPPHAAHTSHVHLAPLSYPSYKHDDPIPHTGMVPC